MIERLLAAERAEDGNTRLGDVMVAHGMVHQADVRAALDRQADGDTLRLGEILVEKGVVSTNDVNSAIHSLKSSTSAAQTNTPSPDAGSADKNPASVTDSTIRVDVALLDKLMTRVGELVLARNQILQHTNGMNNAEFVSTPSV